MLNNPVAIIEHDWSSENNAAVKKNQRYDDHDDDGLKKREGFLTDIDQQKYRYF